MDSQKDDKAVESISSLNICSKSEDTNEVLTSKDELLYETGEDEEEALSDDSVRLRVSDDEIEVEGITSDIYLDEQPIKKSDITLEKQYNTDQVDINNDQFVSTLIEKNITHDDIVICDNETNENLVAQQAEDSFKSRCNVEAQENYMKVLDKNESDKLPSNDINIMNDKLDNKNSVDLSSSQDIITVTFVPCDTKNTTVNSEKISPLEETKNKLDQNIEKENQSLLEQNSVIHKNEEKERNNDKLSSSEPLVINECKKAIPDLIEIRQTSVDKNCTVNEICESNKKLNTEQSFQPSHHEDCKSNITNANDTKNLTDTVHNNLVVEQNLNHETTDIKRRRARDLGLIERNIISQKDVDTGRPKRRTARNAEEIIRKKFLNQDSDVESSDSSEKLVTINHQTNQRIQSLSPPSLKRNCPDNDNVVVNGNMKKVKTSELENILTNQSRISEIKNLDYVHKFFRRDLKEKLPRLTQEELEELLIQKIVETITMKSEIGRLREQARISEKNQEVTRMRCQQLAKQIKDFEMVLTRNAADRRANNDKPIPPIKINRSVGLQVNFTTEYGIQNLRQLQQNLSPKSVNTLNGVNTSTNETATPVGNHRRIKVRSPRRTGAASTVPQSVSTPPTTPSTKISTSTTITPTTLVVQKDTNSKQSPTTQNQINTVQQVQHQQQPSTVLNGKVQSHGSRPNTVTNTQKSNSNDLIDLTDEEEKSKSSSKNKPAVTIMPVATTTNTDHSTQNIVPKTQTCFPRMIQTLATSVAITTQPCGGIRLVQPINHPSPNLNNINAPRLTYVMQSGPPRQLLITSNSNQIRATSACTRPPFTTLAYKTGASTIANGTVRLITTSANPNIPQTKHPAPLPDIPHYAVNTVWKLPPPAPSLKISKVPSGIVLSWNMALSDKHADIVSYQLYAYQEVAGIPPSTSLWKKVGDVRALPLPMACTLTQFSEGNKYYFAVRAVDTHSRKGQYSVPGNISL